MLYDIDMQFLNPSDLAAYFGLRDPGPVSTSNTWANSNVKPPTIDSIRRAMDEVRQIADEMERTEAVIADELKRRLDDMRTDGGNPDTLFCRPEYFVLYEKAARRLGLDAKPNRYLPANTAYMLVDLGAWERFDWIGGSGSGISDRTVDRVDMGAWRHFYGGDGSPTRTTWTVDWESFRTDRQTRRRQACATRRTGLCAECGFRVSQGGHSPDCGHEFLPRYFKKHQRALCGSSVMEEVMGTEAAQPGEVVIDALQAATEMAERREQLLRPRRPADRSAPGTIP